MTRDVFAEALAAANETDQAEFLNQFVRSLIVLCKGSPSGSASMQAHYIAGRLKDDTVSFLKDLVETNECLKVEYRDEVVRDKTEQVYELNRQIAQKRETLDSL